MANNSLVKQITAGGALLIIGAFLVALVANYWIALTQASNSHKEQLDQQLTLISQSMENPLWSLDDKTIKLIGDAYLSGADAARLTVYTQHNEEPIYNKGKVVNARVISGKKEVFHNNQIIGHVEIGLSNALHSASLLRLLVYSIIVASFIVLSLFFVMKKMVRKHLENPLKSLGGWTDSVASGDYSGRPPTIDLEELNSLANKFSNMSEKIQSRELSLQVSEKRFRDLSNLLPGIVFETDLEGEITYTNQTGLDTMQYTQEDIKAGVNISQIFIKSDAVRARENMKIRMSGGAPGENEYTALRKDGTTFPALVLAGTIAKDGQGTGLRGILLDISEQKKMMEEHKRTTQLAVLGTVAAGVAHEVNNPLQGIINYAALIDRAPENAERVKSFAQRIMNEGDRISNITKDLLHYSKDNRSTFVESNICALIRSSISLLETNIRNEAIKIKQSLPIDPVLMRVNPQGIQQIVVNLIDNARDALLLKTEMSNDMNIEVNGFVVDTSDNPSFVLEIIDNGTGIPETLLPKVRDAFFTTKGPNKGTGLGLSIVGEIVQTHNGSLDIESVERDYTKVIVSIPLAP